LDSRLKRNSRANWTKASRGSCFVLQQSKRASDEQQQNRLKLINPDNILNEFECQEILAQNIGCCSHENCLYDAYRTPTGLNTEEFNKDLNQCRLMMSKKSKQEKKEFLYDSFKKYLLKLPNNSKQNYFESEWKSPNDKIICRKSWAILYKIKLNSIEKCSENLKENPESKRPKVSSFKENQIHDYTQNEVSTIFQNNLVDLGNSHFYRILYYYLLFLFQRSRMDYFGSSPFIKSSTSCNLLD
jgi:hypothetical protein